MSWKATAFVKGLVQAPNGEKLTATEKLMMFVLADSHNDDHGKAWPSLRRLAEQSLLSERQARYILRSLESKGLLRVCRGTGRGNTSEYLILGLTERGQLLPPLAKDKRGNLASERGQSGVGKGAVAIAPEPIEQPPREPQEDFTLSPTPLPFELPAWIPREAWEAFVQMRKKISYPLTEYATKLAVRDLDKLRKQGESVEEVLNQSILNCWRGLFSVKGNGYERNYTNRAEERTKRNVQAARRFLERAGAVDAQNG
jgi:DNA-binding MarR family transcriptional regulator